MSDLLSIITLQQIVFSFAILVGDVKCVYHKQNKIEQTTRTKPNWIKKPISTINPLRLGQSKNQNQSQMTAMHRVNQRNDQAAAMHEAN